MANSRAAGKTGRPKAAKLRVGKKDLRDLAPRDAKSGQTKGGLRRQP
jgi:hypothetical protein